MQKAPSNQKSMLLHPYFNEVSKLLKLSSDNRKHNEPRRSLPTGTRKTPPMSGIFVDRVF